MDSLDDIANQFAGDYAAESTNVDSQALKSDLKPLVDDLAALAKEKEEAEIILKNINKKILEKEQSVRTILGPKILSADKFELDIDGIVLKSEKVLNISKESEEDATNWLLNNGFKDAMKYQIHHQTLLSIARKQFTSGVLIPGLHYEPFNKIKVK